MVEKKNKKEIDYSKQGKKNRAAGQRFEAKVRENLEGMGWTVSKWMNTVDYNKNEKTGKIVPAKRKYNPFLKTMIIGTGFPDFIAFKNNENNKLKRGFCENCKKESFNYEVINGFIACDNCGEHIPSVKINQAEIIGIEVKGNGYLDQVEKGMCMWLIQNRTFSRIWIAKKGKNRGEIEYIDFLEKYKKEFASQ